jgi:hypothetical protein
MLKELLIWGTLKCSSCRACSCSRNIIDTRWVIKFKWEQPTVDATAGGRQQSQAKRVIRARLTVRGFKDSDRRDIDRYAVASSRCSQKLFVSEAVKRG